MEPKHVFAIGILNDQPPMIRINGANLGVVSCLYTWKTATDYKKEVTICR